MMFDADFAALLSDRLGARWRPTPGAAGLDNHLRRDLGLPPVPQPFMPILRRHWP